jgi:peptidoglycan/LPS O-acetylase OafA/YrhL
MGLKYEPSLDGVRALAALSVLLFHAHAPGFGAGGQGVQVFFALSGYLITSLLADEVARTGQIDIGDFLLRRVRRLVPALLALVVIVTALTPVLLPAFAPLNLISAMLAVTYTTNIGVMLGLPWAPLAHTWSLGLEMQFYLLWALVAPHLLRTRRPAAILLAMWAALFVLRLGVAAHATSFMLSQMRCIGCLLLGAAAAVLPPGRGWMTWLGAGAIFATGFNGTIISLGGIEIGSFLLISGLRSPSMIGRALSWSPLVYLGLISYGVYLWHFPITRLTKTLSPWVGVPLALGLSVTLATASYITVERWMRAPSKRTARAPAPAT